MGVEWEKRLGLINVDVGVVEDIIDKFIVRVVPVGDVVEVKEGTEGREGFKEEKDGLRGGRRGGHSYTWPYYIPRKQEQSGMHSPYTEFRRRPDDCSPLG